MSQALEAWSLKLVACGFQPGQGALCPCDKMSHAMVCLFRACTDGPTSHFNDWRSRCEYYNLFFLPLHTYQFRTWSQVHLARVSPLAGLWDGPGIRSGVYLIPPYRSQSYLLLPVQVPLRFIVLRADKSSNVGYYTNSIFIEFYYLTNRHTIFHFSIFLIF